MSHRKVYSQGSIPFSWEDSPGVSKVAFQEYFPKSKHGLDALDLNTPPSPPLTTLLPPRDPDGSTNASVQEIKIPLPPCPKPKAQQHPQRSLSARGFKCCQEDPFLAAYKECTKNVQNGKSSGDQRIRNFGSKVRKSKLLFSCKNSYDVKDDTVVKLSNLPPLPRDHRARDR